MEQLIQIWQELESQSRWLKAIFVLGVSIPVYLVFALAIKLFTRRLSRMIEAGSRWNTATDVFQILLLHTRQYFIFASAVLFCTEILLAWQNPNLWIQRVFLILTTLQLLRWASCLIDLWVKRVLIKRADGDAASATTFGLITLAARTVAFSTIILAALNNLGVNITALITGLGVGGIAVALALQNILGDLFASLSIVMDRPFVVGDAIHVDGMGGTVEHIGLKTTRVRSLTGEELIFSNGDLLKSKIRNFKRMPSRRVLLPLAVTYQTGEDQLREIPKITRAIVESQNQNPNLGGTHIRFDRCHLLELLDSSLKFELVYWIDSPEFGAYVQAAHEINIQILSAFKQKRIEFAYPTQTVFQTNVGPES
jgi:small-conductance mechanosensitive channel